MSISIPGNTVVENARSLAQSALPDAPVVADQTSTSRRGAQVWAQVRALASLHRASRAAAVATEVTSSAT
ncbi:hypothetical protein AB0E69_34035 [Kribbella sp. NPDC026611]|uniref:hypothetical protein n=1 Tax=Kribbella sp. NPDC026611 TaxID=3154911 RepID=UPI0033DB5EAD